MPIAKTILLYQFDELSDKAKENARDWWRETDIFSDYVDYYDFLEICAAVGISVKGAGTRDLAISWTGFWSQGDGASFRANWRAKPDAGATIRAHAPQDEELHRIADALAALAVEFPYLCADIDQPYGSRYSHSGTMFVTDLNFGTDDDQGLIAEEDYSRAESIIQDNCRALADWFYRYLQADYEYRNSDESVDESIRINEYTFTESGKRED